MFIVQEDGSPDGSASWGRCHGQCPVIERKRSAAFWARWLHKLSSWASSSILAVQRYVLISLLAAQDFGVNYGCKMAHFTAGQACVWASSQGTVHIVYLCTLPTNACNQLHCM